MILLILLPLLCLWPQRPSATTCKQLSKSLLPPLTQGLCTCRSRCSDYLPSYSLPNFLRNLQDLAQGFSTFQCLPAHPHYPRLRNLRAPDLPMSQPLLLSTAVFHSHIRLLQQTVGSSSETTHLLFTLALPPPSEYGPYE